MTLRLLPAGTSLLLLAYAWSSHDNGRPLPSPALAFPSSSAMLVVVRESLDPTEGVPHTILLDSKPIIRLQPGDALRMPVSVGSHTIAVTCGELPEGDGGYETPVTFGAGETLSFRSQAVWGQACMMSLELLGEQAGGNEHGS